jgi:ATP-dependent Clp protease ATP-binding subunit ClpC
MHSLIGTLRFALRLSLRGFTDQSINAMMAARKHAIAGGHQSVTPEDVLFGIASLPRSLARTTLGNLGLDLEREAMAVKTLADADREAGSIARPALAPETGQLLSRAGDEARRFGVKYVGTEHLVLALLAGNGPAANFLRERGITTDRFIAERRSRVSAYRDARSTDPSRE